jgi:hypothetical protein
MATGSLATDNTWSAGTVSVGASLAGNLTTSGSSTPVPGVYGGLTCVGLSNVSYYSGFVNYTKPNGRQASKPVLRAVPLVDSIDSGTSEPKIATQRRRLLAS